MLEKASKSKPDYVTLCETQYGFRPSSSLDAKTIIKHIKFIEAIADFEQLSGLEASFWDPKQKKFDAAAIYLTDILKMHQDPWIYYYLGKLHSKKDWRSKDRRPDKVPEYYRQAQQGNFLPAARALAILYRDGYKAYYYPKTYELHSDIDLAIHKFKVAGLSGDVESYIELGFLYYNRDNKYPIKPDLDKALEFWQKARDLGSLKIAVFLVNDIYQKLYSAALESGNENKANYYFHEICKCFDTMAQKSESDTHHIIGDIFLNGKDCIQPNIPMAIEYYEKYANFGKFRAQINLIMIHLHQGDDEIAQDARRFILEFLLEGNDLRVKEEKLSQLAPYARPEKSVALFESLIKLDDMPAPTKLMYASLLLDGKKIPKKPEQGIQYLGEIITTADIQIACKALLTLAKFNNDAPTDISEESLLEYSSQLKIRLEKVEDYEKPVAWYLLGKLYLEGCGSIEQNTENAIDYLTKAAENFVKEANELLESLSGKQNPHCGM